MGYVRQCAARQGLVSGALPGRLVLPANEDGAPPPPPLMLAFDAQAAVADDPQAAALREVTLSLDVCHRTRPRRNRSPPGTALHMRWLKTWTPT